MSFGGEVACGKSVCAAFTP
ncbi:hypothetical protein M2G70_24000 [Vibrio vulnificus]|nr:hypothetical protein [Vibrio vulnificus]MCG6312933.1 hypothetical protein [Vibrio vulnificus]MCG9655871.1 hypothetical protein [Vibrio vulnificus]MCU8501687.1 hypothetical protein [Vibrio vulnificus]MCU8505698.1 hypothetical protein [Vibrio vulnificus]MDS1842039.1 hypothetical protein [Vibrio vulnificus]